MKRREFFLSLAGSAALIGTGTWKQFGQDTLKRATGNGWALGTEVRLTLFHTDSLLARKAIDAAFSELDRVESVLSLYREKSDLTELNRTGFLDNPHPWLLEVIESATALSRATNGAFDITIQPLYKTYAEAQAVGILPNDDAIRTARAKVDWRRVVIDRHRITLKGSETAVSLNGIAQGFAADRVAAVLQEYGVTAALIDTGELGSIGIPANRDAWNVGIKHPRQPNTLLTGAVLKGRCLATSGDYETRFAEGYGFHHLFNPATGNSANSLASVSVVANSAMEADGLSTALFVMGLRRGMAFLKERPEAEALFVTKSGEVIPSEGFPLRS